MLIGIAILLGFGSVWLIIGVWQLLRPPAARCAASAGVLAAGALLFAGGARFTQRAHGAGAALDWPAVQTAFIAINVAQYVAFSVAIALAKRRRRSDLILCAIAAIVGAHFVLLAPVFGFSLYYLTGGAMVLTAALSLRLAPRQRDVTVSLVSGAILWTTALALAGASRAAA